MKLSRLRPEPLLAASLAVSVLLHLAAIVQFQPLQGRKPAVAGNVLSVRLERLPEPSLLVRSKPPVTAFAAPSGSRARARRAEKPTGTQVAPLPTPAVQDPSPQPLRTRFVPSPSEYGVSARPGDEAARPYFWSTEVSTQPRLRHEIAVIYPEEAKERGVKGLVVVRVELTTLGNIARLETVCSAPDFGQAVAEALAAAQFSPALSARGATAVWMLLEFAFLSEADGKINADRAEANLAQLQRQCEEQRRSRSGGAAPLRPFPPSAPASARARAGG